MKITTVFCKKKKKKKTCKQKYNKTCYTKVYRNWREFDHIWRGYLLALGELISFIFSALQI